MKANTGAGLSREERVRDVGEFGLIERIAHIIGETKGIVGLGDDAAVIDQPGADYLLATTDMLVEEVHFRRQEIDPFDLGRRALAVNLSDIAAMGGKPTFALTSIAVSPDTQLSYLEKLYEGLQHEAAAYGATIVGGNVSGTKANLVLDLALLGQVPKANVLLRSEARVGDVLATTGMLGGAAAARLLIEKRLASFAGNQEFVARHRVPQPRLRAGEQIAASHLAHAMIDLSDGLASDVQHLGQASRCGAVIYAGRVPIDEETKRAARMLSIDPLELALTGGEDYELLVALPRGAVAEVERRLQDVPLHVIGEMLPVEHGFQLEREDGKREPLKPGGWRHF